MTKASLYVPCQQEQERLQAPEQQQQQQDMNLFDILGRRSPSAGGGGGSGSADDAIINPEFPPRTTASHTGYSTLPYFHYQNHERHQSSQQQDRTQFVLSILDEALALIEDDDDSETNFDLLFKSQ